MLYHNNDSPISCRFLWLEFGHIPIPEVKVVSGANGRCMRLRRRSFWLVAVRWDVQYIAVHFHMLCLHSLCQYFWIRLYRRRCNVTALKGWVEFRGSLLWKMAALFRCQTTGVFFGRQKTCGQTIYCWWITIIYHSLSRYFIIHSWISSTRLEIFGSTMIFQLAQQRALPVLPGASSLGSEFINDQIPIHQREAATPGEKAAGPLMSCGERTYQNCAPNFLGLWYILPTMCNSIKPVFLGLSGLISHSCKQQSEMLWA